MEAIKCNKCEWLGHEEDLIKIRDPIYKDVIDSCPNCETDHYLTNTK